ncbi:MAG: AgmX/PglI C-terminal domain-containing protein [Myxococcales bacterium]|nr:AgmX/PglI C-terminal domain-containing protein [Myxococcales bacterium]
MNVPVRTARLCGGLLALAVACTPRGGGDDGVLPARTIKADEPSGPRPPMTLTASDGTGLRLVALKARGVVEEPLAFTELHMTFENPTDRTIEGRFEIDMPHDAAISRFAMLVHGNWQEGEVVERRAAQVAYEDFLHRKQDPALLENNAGNSFTARVFPIGPRERKQLILSYSQELPSSGEPYRLMLRGLPQLDELDASVLLREQSPPAAGVTTNLAATHAQTRTIALRRQLWQPDQDLEVSSSRGAQVLGLRHQNLAVARVAPSGAMPPAPIGALTVLFDTSASRALDFDRQIHQLGEVVRGLREQSREDFALRVLCFDQTTAEVFNGPASELSQVHLDRISTRRPLGASDLRQALAAVAVQPLAGRVLVFSDGIATAGADELSELTAAASALRDAGVERIDAVIDGGIQDAATLKALTTAGLARSGIVADARLPLDKLVHKLASQTLPTMKVEVPGSAWVWPDKVEGAQPGDELLVYADLPESMAMKVVLTGDTPIEVDVPGTAVERPLLERAWVGARIARLTDERSALPPNDADKRDALHKQIVELSTKFRVLSDFTALLVLESDWDYSRFNIDRNALTDIMIAGPDGVLLKNRNAPMPVQPAQPPQIAVDPPQKPLPTIPDSAPIPVDQEDSDEEAAGQRHKGEEGKMGKPTSKSGLYAMKGPQDAIPQMARNFDPDMAARNNGILGVAAAEQGHFLASPYGGAFAVGNDDSDVWGGLTGTEVGESYGVGGLGLVGTGRGGGGTGEGTIGLGNTGLVGKGGGTGSGYGRGAGAGFGGRGTRVPTVRQAKAEVQGALDKDIIRRIVRAHINEVRYCYNQALARDPYAGGRVAVQFTIGGTGKVPSAVVQESTMKDAAVGNCIAKAVRRWTFPKPQGGGSVIVTYPFVLEPGGGVPYRPLTPEEQAERDRVAAIEAAERAQREAEQQRMWAEADARRQAEEKLREAERAAEAAEAARTEGSPYNGRMFDIMKQLERGETREALGAALAWQESAPGDVVALIALGEAAEAAGDKLTAARAYGSLIDLFPSRADLRRYAGARLERLGDTALALAVDTFAHAVEQRPDHPASHRLHAYALSRVGRHADAFAAILKGIDQRYPSGRFLGVERILGEDAGILAAAWLAAEPHNEAAIRKQTADRGISIANQPSLRFVINWETDANDVDFHIMDSNKDRAWYGHKLLQSGGELFADVTTGYGPECFAIPGKAAAFPYTFKAHYFSRGPMGYGMGKLQIVQHDGRGGLKYDDRPFIIMKDGADATLGDLQHPL